MKKFSLLESNNVNNSSIGGWIISDEDIRKLEIYIIPQKDGHKDISIKLDGDSWHYSEDIHELVSIADNGLIYLDMKYDNNQIIIKNTVSIQEWSDKNWGIKPKITIDDLDDIEDYFMDFFDMSDYDWNIQIIRGDKIVNIGKYIHHNIFDNNQPPNPNEIKIIFSMGIPVRKYTNSRSIDTKIENEGLFKKCLDHFVSSKGVKIKYTPMIYLGSTEYVDFDGRTAYSVVLDVG